MIILPTDKIAIYTAIIGNYDKEIFKSVYKDINADMFLITNTDCVKAPDRKVIYIKEPINNSTRSARFIKTHPHIYFGEYKYSLWIDGHISIIGNIRNMINNNIPDTDFTGMVFLEHPWRNCIYDEAEECIKQNKDYKEIILNQVCRYSIEGFPRNNGLIRSGVIFREHNNNNIIDIMEQWWSEIENGSRRDQLSFDYVIWKGKYKYNRLNKDYYKKYFKQHKCHNTHV